MMNISYTIEELHLKAKQNKWLRHFTVFNRLALAAGFIPSGFVKITGERFTSLSVHHPMGHYLDALYQTGYYYTFIGVAQLVAAALLLIPRTATLGALLYFPIILNICVLSFSLRFEGSLLSSPLMLLANLYLLCWDYDKLKSIVSGRHPSPIQSISTENIINTNFPVKFFAGSAAVVIIMVFVLTMVFDIQPRNTKSDCALQCKKSKKPNACLEFCNCIHMQGQPLELCLRNYNSTYNDTSRQ